MRQLTLDEWRALQADTRPPTNFNIRRSGEGCTSDPRWNKMHLLKKKHNDGDEDISGQFDDAVSVKILNPLQCSECEKA